MNDILDIIMGFNNFKYALIDGYLFIILLKELDIQLTSNIRLFHNRYRRILPLCLIGINFASN